MKELKGIGVSEGIVIGPARVFENTRPEIEEAKDEIPCKCKLQVLRDAIDRTKADIRQTYERTRATNQKEAEIFEAHILFLEDPTLLDEIGSMLREG